MATRKRRRNPRGQELTDRVARALLAVAKLVAFDPRNLAELHAAAVGDPPPRRRNPAHIHAAVSDPKVEEISERFHGTNTETAVLDADQMPPREVAVVGTLEGIDYKADAHSQRAGEWFHEAGDRGPGKPRSRGRGLVVTDGKKVWAVPSDGPTFSPDRGIVG